MIDLIAVNIDWFASLASIVLSLITIIIASFIYKRQKKVSGFINKISKNNPYLSKDILLTLKQNFINLQGFSSSIEVADKSEMFDIVSALLKFMNKEFLHKYLFLIGPVGSGKTSTLIMAMEQYLSKGKSGLEIKLLSMREEELFTVIKSLPIPEKTILILDGLDESPEIIANQSKFLEELHKNTNHFNKVLISCRTLCYETFDINHIFIENNNLGEHSIKPLEIFIAPLTKAQMHNFLKKIDFNKHNA